jgi:hypothetical protein
MGTRTHRYSDQVILLDTEWPLSTSYLDEHLRECGQFATSGMMNEDTDIPRRIRSPYSGSLLAPTRLSVRPRCPNLPTRCLVWISTCHGFSAILSSMYIHKSIAHRSVMDGGKGGSFDLVELPALRDMCSLAASAKSFACSMAHTKNRS